MSISRSKHLLALAVVLTGAATATCCLAQQAATPVYQQVAVSQHDLIQAAADKGRDNDRPNGLSNTCRAGSFQAGMAVKLPPSARPGKREWYKDCPY